MTINEQIITIENKIFYLEMKDNWDSNDWNNYYAMRRDLEKLQREAGQIN